MQRYGKDISAAVSQHTTIQEAVFSVGAAPTLYNEGLMQHINEFEILAPLCPTHYSPAGNGDVLDIVVHKNVRVSEVTVSDILNSDNLPIVFHLLDHVRTRNHSGPIEKFAHWERFQRLASELISPRIQINSEEEADKAARDFTASIASACRLSTSTLTLSDLHTELPGPEILLKHKRRLRKLWQLIRHLIGSPKPSNEWPAERH
jgi:hypothetical protein